MLASALEVGAEVLQTFASNPRGWATPPLDRERIRQAGRKIREARLGPVFLHAPYLVNLASPNPGFLARSIVNLRSTIEHAEVLGAGVVVHAGSAGATERDEALSRVRRTLLPLVEETSAGVLIELTAGGAGSVASTWSQAGELLEALGGHDTVRFCFDTCHAFSAGYDVTTPDGIETCFAEMARSVGVDRLGLVHANDSKDPRGSHRDRHEHLGRGTIGEVGFRALMRSAVARAVPIVVETPPEGQAADIALLRRVAAD